MRLLFLLLLLLLGCDSVTIDYKVGKCMEHSWAYKGTYQITKRDGMKVFMKNVETGETISISGIDKGWDEIACR